MKKGILVLLVLIAILSSGFFGHNLMQAMAEEEAAVSYSKYYTSIRLEEGDTLWKLAERYNNHSEKSMEAYVRELKSMNLSLIHI